MQNKAVFRAFFGVFKSMFCALVFVFFGLSQSSGAQSVNYVYKCTPDGAENNVVKSCESKPTVWAWYTSGCSSTYNNYDYFKLTKTSTGGIRYPSRGTLSSYGNEYYGTNCVYNDTYKMEPVRRKMTVYYAPNASTDNYPCCLSSGDCDVNYTADGCICTKTLTGNDVYIQEVRDNNNTLHTTYVGKTLKCGNNYDSTHSIKAYPLDFSIQLRCNIQGTGDPADEQFITKWNSNVAVSTLSNLCDYTDTSIKWSCKKSGNTTETFVWDGTARSCDSLRPDGKNSGDEYPIVRCVPEREQESGGEGGGGDNPGGGGGEGPDPEPDPDPDDPETPEETKFGYGTGGASWKWPDQVTTSEIKNLVN